MLKSKSFLAVAVLYCLLAPCVVAVADTSENRLERLVTAYPDVLCPTVQNNAVGWCADDTIMRFDDGLQSKSGEQLLNAPDLEDQVILYPYGENYTIRKGDDPGRVRYEPFFRKMYGNSPLEVSKHLTTIRWLPHFTDRTLQVTTINGVAGALEAVSDDLEKLLEQPEYRSYIKYLDEPAGTVNWRVIAGTSRLSVHSFGIAIDINTRYSDYWRWNGDSGYQNQIPIEIVLIFEKHGFIWGGKWSHYDTMHFEYRPELFVDQGSVKS